MSRFDDNFDSDLTVIAERVTPSPDAWASIKQRIADREPTKETEIIMLTDNTLTRRRRPLVAAAAAVAALAIGAIALVNRGDVDEQPADVPTPTLAPAPDPEAETGGALELPPVGSLLEPGRYTSNATGVTVSFTVDEGQTAPWTLRSNQEPGGIQLWSDDTGREFLAIGRAGSWYNSAEARDGEMTGLGSISPDDIDGWIEQNGIIVADQADVEIGSRPAQYRQIRLDTTPGAGADFCPAGEQPCLWAATGSADTIEEGPTPIPFSRDRLHSIWLVDMDDYEPLVILAIPNLDDEQAWFETVVQPIVDSMEFGEPAPVIEGGMARVSTFGAGVESTALELPPPGGAIEPGRYASDALGVPVEFDLDVGQTASWSLAIDEPGQIRIKSEDSDLEFVNIGRVGSWYDAAEARTADTTGLGSLPPDDIDGWIAQNGIIVVDSSDIEVGGRPTKYRQFRLDATPGATPDACGFGGMCLWAITGSADVPGAANIPIPASEDRAQSMWLVDMDEFEPVYIYAAARLGDDDDQRWFTEVLQPIIASMTFGEPAPAVEGGTARVPRWEQFFASYSGTRNVGAVLEDGTREVTGSNAVEGDLTGELTATGIEVTPANGYDDLVFTGSIDGIGTGTLTMYQEWSASGNGDIATTNFVTGGTGDFVGFTGRVFTSVDVPDESGSEPIYSGRMTFELAIPRSG